MVTTVREVVDKLQRLEDAIDAMDDLANDYCVCKDASDLLSEYRSLILGIEVDL